MRTVFPSTMKVTRSPLDTPRTSRISFGIVICPFAMTLALSTNVFGNMTLHHLSEIWKVENSLLLLYAKGTEKPMEERKLFFWAKKDSVCSFFVNYYLLGK